MDDYISRQDAINALENTDCELLPEEWDMLTDSIMCIPAAPVREVKRGRWITEKRSMTIYPHRCSECGASQRAKYDYCPSCGADNREDGNET